MEKVHNKLDDSCKRKDLQIKCSEKACDCSVKKRSHFKKYPLRKKYHFELKKYFFLGKENGTQRSLLILISILYLSQLNAPLKPLLSLTHPYGLNLTLTQPLPPPCEPTLSLMPTPPLSPTHCNSLSLTWVRSPPYYYYFLGLICSFFLVCDL